MLRGLGNKSFARLSLRCTTMASWTHKRHFCVNGSDGKRGGLPLGGGFRVVFFDIHGFGLFRMRMILFVKAFPGCLYVSKYLKQIPVLRRHPPHVCLRLGITPHGKENTTCLNCCVFQKEGNFFLKHGINLFPSIPNFCLLIFGVKSSYRLFPIIYSIYLQLFFSTIVWSFSVDLTGAFVLCFFSPSQVALVASFVPWLRPLRRAGHLLPGHREERTGESLCGGGALCGGEDKRGFRWKLLVVRFGFNESLWPFY